MRPPFNTMTDEELIGFCSKKKGESPLLDEIVRRLDARHSECPVCFAQLDGQPTAEVPPVAGDLLPAIGSTVYFKMASSQLWVKHKVVGYYVRPLDYWRYRVFVRGVSESGVLNARFLSETRTAA